MIQPCSIVIPTYNGLEYLQRSVPSLLEAIAFCGGEHEIIVVDNGSSDSSLAFLQDFGPPVRAIALEDNLGFARACNLGAEMASNYILLFLNNDMYFDRGFLAPLLNHFDEHEDLFSVGAQIWDWQQRYQAGRVFGEFVLGSFQPVEDPERYQQVCYTLYTSGAASAMDRHKFEQLGGFDEALYIYEDVDIGYRAWKRGWSVLHEPHSIVYHKGRATSRHMFSHHKYLIINLRNRFWFIWKNLTDSQIIVPYLALLPLSLPYLMLRLKSPAPLVAFLTALRRLGAIGEQRAHESRLAIRSDSEILRFVREHIYVTETA